MNTKQTYFLKILYLILSHICTYNTDLLMQKNTTTKLVCFLQTSSPSFGLFGSTTNGNICKEQNLGTKNNYIMWVTVHSNMQHHIPANQQENNQSSM